MYASPNLDAAKKFLEASGYSASNPLKLDVWYPPEHYGASTVAAMELIKTQLEATGEIQVNSAGSGVEHLRHCPDRW